MAGQAGWYRAPGEEGLLRYWSGAAWTEHRMPQPEPEPAPAEPVVAEAAVEPVVPEQAVAEPEVAEPAVAQAEQAEPLVQVEQAVHVEPEPVPNVAAEVASSEVETAQAVSADAAAPGVAMWDAPTTEDAAPLEDSKPTVPNLDFAAIGLSVPSAPEAPADEHVEPEPEPEPGPEPEPEPEPELHHAPELPSEPDWSMDQFEKQFLAPSEPMVGLEPDLHPIPAPSEPDSHLTHRAPTETEPVSTFEHSVPLSADQSSHASAFSAQQAPVLEATAMEAPISAFSPPALAPEAPGSLAGAPAPFAMPSAEPAVSVSLANAPAPVADPPTLLFSEPSTADQAAPAPETSASPQRQATEAPVVTPEVRKRRSLIRAARGILVGVIIILLGVGGMYYLSLSSGAVAAGHVKTVGIVTELQSTSQGCVPSARFAAVGGSFIAHSAGTLTPCPFSLGETIDVSYAKGSPSSTGQIIVPDPLLQYVWGVPAIGGVVFLASLFIFIMRAGSIVAGITLIRDGNIRRRRSTADAPPLA